MREKRSFNKGTDEKKNEIDIMIAPLLLVLAVMFASSNALALDIPLKNGNLSFRWDNTLRYNLMSRASSQDDLLLNSPNFDDGNRNFEDGIVMNRLDILSEADFVYKKTIGVRVSGAFWYDQKYNENFDNDSVATSNYIDKNGNQAVNELYDFTKDNYAGPDGELLDAFFFARMEPASVPVFIKAGRHIYSWGQGMLNPYHAISYGQMPLDLAKGAAQPGVEAKEMFRPTNSISAVIQFTPEFQFASQYYLEWERNKTPGEGTYFSQSDVSFHNGDGVMLNPLLPFPVRHGKNIEPEDTGDFGLAFQWTPRKLFDTTFGLYYRRFSDRMPTFIVDMSSLTYHCAYKSDIDLYGISYASTFLGMSVGAEVSYRKDMPLSHNPATIFTSNGLPDKGDVLGATGETLHAVVNTMNLLKRSPFWDSGNWVLEFDYSRWLDVTDDPYNTFKGADGYDKFDRVTKDALMVALMFTPSYYQVLPGLDLDVPLSCQYGISGVSPIVGGNGKGDGFVSIGLNFTYLNRYKINFTYSNFFGDLEEDTINGVLFRGNYALYKDKDFVSLTVKYSF